MSYSYAKHEIGSLSSKLFKNLHSKCPTVRGARYINRSLEHSMVKGNNHRHSVGYREEAPLRHRVKEVQKVQRCLSGRSDIKSESWKKSNILSFA